MLTSVSLTVLFNEPFWIGIFEVQEEKVYKTCKVTFGTEPKEFDVFDLILKNYFKLNFTKREELDKSNSMQKINPKRLQRIIKKQTQNKGIGTKAQLALQEQFSANKIESKKRNKERKEAEELRKYELRKIKQREKHKGH